MGAPVRYDATQRELAYRVWRQSGQSIAETLRRLDREHDWPLAKQTLADWRDQGNWLGRAAADDVEERRRARAETTDRVAMLSGLDLQIERYQDAFGAQAAEGSVPDPRAVSAYANLLRLRLELVRDLDTGAGLNRGDVAADVVEWLSDFAGRECQEHAPALAAILERAAGSLAVAFA